MAPNFRGCIYIENANIENIGSKHKQGPLTLSLHILACAAAMHAPVYCATWHDAFWCVLMCSFDHCAALPLHHGTWSVD